MWASVAVQAPTAGQQPVYGGTPHTDHISASGLGSAMTFDEDASIGPEPILFSRNFGGMANPGGTQDPHVSFLSFADLSQVYSSGLLVRRLLTTVLSRNAMQASSVADCS